MKKIIFALYVGLSGSAISQTLDWVKAVASANRDNVVSMTYSPDGDIITMGYYENDLTIGFETGDETFNNGGSQDMFILKSSPNGDFLWGTSISAPDQVLGKVVKTDNEGNIFVAGHFKGTVDFDPGAGTTTAESIGDYNGFLLKLDVDGEFQWVRTARSVDNVYSYVLEVDAENNTLYWGGSFNNTAFFNWAPELGEVSSQGLFDGFIARVDLDGECTWLKRFGGLADDRLNNIAIDDDGNPYLVGSFAANVDFDFGPETNTLSASGSDFFCLKIDANGAFQWVNRFGGGGEQIGTEIEIQGTNVFVAGEWEGTMDFDPTGDTDNRPSNGDLDVFFSKMSTSGEFNWVKGFGGAGKDVVEGIGTSEFNEVYLVGDFYTTVDFDPGDDEFVMVSTGYSDGYLAKFDSGQGELVTAFQIGDGANDDIISILPAGYGEFYVSGFFSWDCDFAPNDESEILFSIGDGLDGFIAKYTFETAAGVEDLNAVSEVTAYPNPFSETTTVYFGEGLENYSIQIVDLLGNKVYANGQLSGNTLEIEADEFKAGMYILIVIDNKSNQIISNVKLIVN